MVHERGVFLAQPTSVPEMASKMHNLKFLASIICQAGCSVITHCVRSGKYLLGAFNNKWNIGASVTLGLGDE